MSKPLLFGVIALAVLVIVGGIGTCAYKGVGAYQAAQAETAAIIQPALEDYGRSGWAPAALVPHASPELRAVIETDPGPLAAIGRMLANEGGAFQAVESAGCNSFSTNVTPATGKVATATCAARVRSETADIAFTITLQGLGDGWRVHGLQAIPRPREAAGDAA